MMPARLLWREAGAAAATSRDGGRGGGRSRRFALGGFNLLPYRQRNARLARRHRTYEWIGAALAGCIGVLALGAWQVVEKARFDTQRASLEQSLSQLKAPLAEHDALLRTERERRDNAARAVSLSKPLVHLRDLLEALSFEPGDGVTLRQLRQQANDTQLLASSRDALASAEWLKRLGTIRGVRAAEVSDLRRPTPRGGAQAVTEAGAPVEFGAHLRWDEPAAPTAGRGGTAKLARAAQGLKPDQTGGAR